MRPGAMAERLARRTGEERIKGNEKLVMKM